MATVRAGNIVVSNEVSVRDESGRFLAEVEAGAAAAARELTESVAALARVFAPFKRGVLAGSIQGVMQSATSGVAIATAGHAAAQEKGAGPHPIGAPGQLLSNREEGFAARGPVMHPGNRAQRYLTRAGEAVGALSVGILRKNLPGG